MEKNIFTKGLIAGTIIGATLSMAVNPLERRDRKMIKRKMGGFIRGVGDSVGGMMNMRW